MTQKKVSAIPDASELRLGMLPAATDGGRKLQRSHAIRGVWVVGSRGADVAGSEGAHPSTAERAASSTGRACAPMSSNTSSPTVNCTPAGSHGAPARSGPAAPATAPVLPQSRAPSDAQQPRQTQRDAGDAESRLIELRQRHEGWPVTLTSERARDVCDNDVESLTGSTLPVVLWLCASQRYTTHPECRPV